MRLPAYNALAKTAIELALLWHNSTVQIATGNHDIFSRKLSKYMKTQNPAKPWGPKDYFMGSGYYTHNTEGYVLKPESLVVPSWPPPAEDQVFFLVPRNPDEPCVRVDTFASSVFFSAF